MSPLLLTPTPVAKALESFFARPALLAHPRAAKLSPEQRERVRKVNLQAQQQAVFSRAKALLGAGHNLVRLRGACDAALEATRQPQGNQQAAFVEALRRGEPSVLSSKAEELCRQIFGNV